MVAPFLDDNKTNDDSDGKENGKQTTTLHVNHAILYISLPLLHHYDTGNFLISRARFMELVNKTQKLSLSCFKLG